MSPMNETRRAARPIALILAGGGAARMGGVDKSALVLRERRLIDHVLTRLLPQTDRILISGAHDCGTGLTALADRDDGPRGPAAGLWAMLAWIEKNVPGEAGFATVPVDGPFLPIDLLQKLTAPRVSAIAADRNGAHPTFAHWRVDELRAVLQASPTGAGRSLKSLAETVGAKQILFDDENAFFNINTPEDLARAERIVDAFPEEE